MDYYTQELGCGCANGGTCPECEAAAKVENKSQLIDQSVSSKAQALPGQSKPPAKPTAPKSVKPLPSKVICDDTGLLIASGGFAMMFLIAAAINSD